MNLLHSIFIDAIRARGSIRDSEIEALRQAWTGTSELAIRDVEALMRLNTACPVKGRGWSELFIEIVTELVVHQMEPVGYVTLAKMRWLLARIVSGDAVAGRTELELIINVLDKSRWSPASLVAFAIGQVRRAIETGEGPLRAGVQLVPGRIMEAEIDFIRRALFAFGNGKALPVTAAEAEALLEISAVLSPDSLPAEWVDLFVKSMANAVLSASGYAAPTREEALRISAGVTALGRRSASDILREAFESGRTPGFEATAGLDAMPAVWGTYRHLTVEEQALARLERQRIAIITDETMSLADAEWLRTRLIARGSLNAGEQALILTLKRDCPAVDPALASLVERTGAAA